MNGFSSVRAAVGWQGPEREHVVERRHLTDFLRAIGERVDAAATGTVPPTFCAAFLTEPPECEAASTYGTGWLNGGDRFELLRDLRVGDRVRARQTLTDAAEKHGRSGPMAVLTFVTEFRLPDEEVAVRHIGTRIRR